MIIENSKARLDYEILSTMTAGLVLKGWEIKSINKGKVSLVSSFCDTDDKFLNLVGVSITPGIEHNYVDSSDEKRVRRLLVNSYELDEINKHLQIKGNTVVPLKIFRNDKGKYKILIGLCRGKKKYDKRQSIKERDIERDLNRNQ